MIASRQRRDAKVPIIWWDMCIGRERARWFYFSVRPIFSITLEYKGPGHPRARACVTFWRLAVSIGHRDDVSSSGSVAQRQTGLEITWWGKLRGVA